MPGQRQLAAAVAVDDRRNYVIAALAGMSPNTLGGIISGRVVPSGSARSRLAEVLGVPEAELFPEEQA